MKEEYPMSKSEIFIMSVVLGLVGFSFLIAEPLIARYIMAVICFSGALYYFRRANLAKK